MAKLNINIACGDSYVNDWLNFDFSPTSSHVIQANLLNRIPVADNMALIIYSSHFFEHIPKELVPNFLYECFRILSSNGYIRLVMPDLEEMCSEYLAKRKMGQNIEADFLMLEMLDQCTRQNSGGDLAAYYQNIVVEKNTKAMDYVYMRTGETLTHYVAKDLSHHRLANALKHPDRLWQHVCNLYCKVITFLLPAAFRKQNVSFTLVGERHAWIYDFYTIKKLLESAGFTEVKKVSFNTTDIADFPLTPLDIDGNGNPRKGSESMYIEARKP